MKTKKLCGILIATILFVLPMCEFAGASLALPAYAITDSVVIINYVPYKINDNKIIYNGLNYEIEDNLLVSYDDDILTLFVLPIEENKITDPQKITELNASISESSSNTRATTSTVTIPYQANVPLGQWQTVTPTFYLNGSGYNYLTYLKLNNFSSASDRKFLIIAAVKSADGTWSSGQIEHTFVAPFNAVRFQNDSGMTHGRFTITNLYGDPSPSYTYRIYFNWYN